MSDERIYCPSCLRTQEEIAKGDALPCCLEAKIVGAMIGEKPPDGGIRFRFSTEMVEESIVPMLDYIKKRGAAAMAKALTKAAA